MKLTDIILYSSLALASVAAATLGISKVVSQSQETQRLQQQLAEANAWRTQVVQDCITYVMEKEEARLQLHPEWEATDLGSWVRKEAEENCFRNPAYYIQNHPADFSLGR